MADWQDVVLTTLDLKKDYEVLDVISTVATDGTWKSHAKHLDLDISSGWLEQGTLDNLFTTVSGMLRNEAHQMGANAIVGVDFDVGIDSTGFFVVGFGTAVKY
jgi:hypothetical protein|tara:strand:+ start:168 stop:476 length:309 start_codon:yes stop_codon:yes gene_type:complete